MCVCVCVCVCDRRKSPRVACCVSSLTRAAAMFHDQQLFERAMKVRMDKMGSTESSSSQGIPDKLPCECRACVTFPQTRAFSNILEKKSIKFILRTQWTHIFGRPCPAQLRVNRWFGLRHGQDASQLPVLSQNERLRRLHVVSLQLV